MIIVAFLLILPLLWLSLCLDHVVDDDVVTLANRAENVEKEEEEDACS